ncbi:polyphosphate kinase [Yersinia phage vB_YenM_P744]
MKELDSFTVERLEEILNFDLPRHPAALEEIVALARIALAAKSAEPIAIVVSKYGDPEAFGERELNLLADINKMPYGMPLFTSYKPGILPRHTFSMLVNELRDAPPIGCKRELIVGILSKYNILPESVE